MPFDKISPQMLYILRIITGMTLLGIGGGLAFLAVGFAFDPTAHTTRFGGDVSGMFVFAALNFGVLLANAGVMLLELVTKPPMKMAINVPFVAANFQISVAIGLVALMFALRHASLPGEASADVMLMQTLCIAGFVLNLMFVVMTKMHWNFTENTGKALPKS